MPTIYVLKPRFQNFLRPASRALHRCGITANAVTLAAVFSSMLYGGWMALDSTRRNSFLFLPLFMVARLAFNAIDGMIAREYQQQTKLGAVLNEVGDVVSDTALYMPFALLPGVYSGAVVIVVFLSILTEFVGVVGQVIGGGRRYDGPLGKSDRAFVFGFFGLLAGINAELLPHLNPAMLAISILLGWTILNRARRALLSAA